MNPISSLEVNTVKGDQLIIPAEILYLEADNRHTIIHFINSKQVRTSHQLKWFEENLPESQFCRCHHSYIVNCFYIECTCGNRAILKVNDVSVPVSRKKMQYYKDSLTLYKQNETFRLLQNNGIHSSILPDTPK
jgi:DNA-binding LytR/AlgR family response regulator